MARNSIAVFVLAVLVVLVLFAGIGGYLDLTKEDENREPLGSMRILLVSPDAAEGHGARLETLLREHGVTVERTDWAVATVEHARDFHLVIVTGPRRRATGEEVLDYDRPVLGIGPYGHVVFGLSHLKHGSPFS